MQTDPRTQPGSDDVLLQLESHRRELTAHCYRMLGSAFEADDAVQDTMVRAWRAYDSFEGRSALRSWLYRIATNVCLDMLNGRKRRARPMDLGPASPATTPVGPPLPEVTWLEPIPDSRVVSTGSDPADVADARASIRLAFVAALQHLPPRQRAVLDPPRGAPLEGERGRRAARHERGLGEQRAPAGPGHARRERDHRERHRRTDGRRRSRRSSPRYVDAFERYDMESLTSLLAEEATQSMPPLELWLSGRDEIFTFWLGQGAACRGSRVVPTTAANGSPAFGQYKPSGPGGALEPWALQVLEISDGRIVELSFFLDVERVFPLFGLPMELDG